MNSLKILIKKLGISMSNPIKTCEMSEFARMIPLIVWPSDKTSKRTKDAPKKKRIHSLKIIFLYIESIFNQLMHYS